MGDRYAVALYLLYCLYHFVTDRTERQDRDIIPLTELLAFSDRQGMHLVPPIRHLSLTARITDHERAVTFLVPGVHQVA